MSSAARSAARADLAASLRVGWSRRRRCRRSAVRRITESRLLKSCATPPASRPTPRAVARAELLVGLAHRLGRTRSARRRATSIRRTEMRSTRSARQDDAVAARRGSRSHRIARSAGRGSRADRLPPDQDSAAGNSRRASVPPGPSLETTVITPRAAGTQD